MRHTTGSGRRGCSAIGLLCLGALQPTDREWEALFATPIACDRRDHLALISDPGMLTRKGEQNHRNFGCHVRDLPRFALLSPASSTSQLLIFVGRVSGFIPAPS